ncbi:MAG: hypothetical protein S4CHLAM6_00330 [Chlamydiae bacterium]|nr:hypothetical protein [Chlamydiota bacterium]
MDPIYESNNPLIKSCFTLDVSYLDNFFSKVGELKKESNWKHIVLLGQLALESNKSSLDQRGSVHATLSSSCFYLGEYDLGIEHARKCKLMGEYLDDPSHIIRGLYLISAHKRIEANLCNEPGEKRKLFKEAQTEIQKAIKYFDRCSDEFVKAKALFNGAAAAADEPDGNLEVAVQWFRKAMDIFLKLEKYDDYNRTTIRLAKAALLLNNHNGCYEILKNIQLDSLTQKTTVHYLYVKAQYFVATKQFSDACTTILDAIEIALELGMKTDLERLNVLLDEIKTQEGNILTELHLKC